MHTVKVTSTAPPAAVWPLLAQPARWPEWAPHIRGARGLGDPEVMTGRRGVVFVLGAIVVPVKVIDLRPGREWRWRAGPVRFRHGVEAAGSGSIICFEMAAPALLEPALALTYGPVMGLVARRLAQVAARPAPPS